MHEKASSHRYMVVFQYGSAVLFNIEDHEVDNYLELVRRHASGLLLEMRKDGNFSGGTNLSFTSFNVYP